MSLPVFLCSILKYIIINITTITDYANFIILIIVI